MSLSNLDHQAYKSSQEMLSDSSTSSDSYDTSDIFEDPVLHPRVGDEYQAEIPPLSSDSELLAEFSRSSVTGLPIPVVWVYDHANSRKHNNFESEDGYFAFPGLSSETWSDFEGDCFLLGLYIFGKNLLLAKKFMESKDIGQILSYYYGQFHGSGAFHKWSECRKRKIKKCIVGERFFTGCRQQKLLSRLLPRLSEECKTKLLEASSAFSEGVTSLDEYVFSLKTLVGIRVLVEVIAIGKGKEDLTTLVDSKNTQIFTRKNHPGKLACSSLTFPEIVKYLTGDIRLSKARSSDLFWEAVWPRLLERGWRSEDPRVDVYGGSKNGLVFLMPGITDFSRINLIKGEDYFDSLTDILAKVASEPKLIELEIDATNKPGCLKEENGWVLKEVNSDNHEHNCNYLKPAKITVVDTSLASEENPLKTREFRSLPILDANRSSNVSNRLRKEEKDSKTKRRRVDSYGKGIVSFVLSLPARDKNAIVKKNAVPPRVNQQNVKAEIEKNAVLSKNVVPPEAKVASSHGKIIEDKMDEKNEAVRMNVVPFKVNQEFVKEKVASFDWKISDDKMDEKNAVLRKHFSDQIEVCIPSDGKIVGDKMAEKNVAVGKNVEPSKLNQQNVNMKVKVKVKVKVASSDEKILEDKMDDKNAKTSSENGKITESRNIIDLNLPPTENGVNDDAKEMSEEVKGNPCDTKDALVSSLAVEPNRRHSKRNRPLTTKALEALEIDFMNPARQTRKRSSSLTEDQKHSKNTYRSQNSESFVFSDIAGFQERAAA